MRTKPSILALTKYSFLLSCFFLGCNKKDLKEDDSPGGTRIFELIDTFGGTVEKQTFKYSGDQFSGVADSTWPLQDPANKQFYYSTAIELNAKKEPTKVTHSTVQHIFDHVVYITRPANHSLVVRWEYPGPSIHPVEHWFGLDAKGRAVVDSFYDLDTKIVYYIDSIEYDQNDNITKTKRFTDNGAGTFTFNYEVEFTYDQKINPFYQQRSLFHLTKFAFSYYFFGKNNPLTKTYVDTLNNVRSLNEQYTYQYNADGLPVKRTLVTYPMGNPNSYAYNIEYRYE